jgi:hypothetical protein
MLTTHIGNHEVEIILQPKSDSLCITASYEHHSVSRRISFVELSNHVSDFRYLSGIITRLASKAVDNVEEFYREISEQGDEVEPIRLDSIPLESRVWTDFKGQPRLVSCGGCGDRIALTYDDSGSVECPNDACKATILIDQLRLVECGHCGVRTEVTYSDSGTVECSNVACQRHIVIGA